MTSAVIDNRLAERAALAWFVISGATVREETAALAAAIEERCSDLRARFATPSDAAPLLRDARRLYHDLGIDPSKRRPSSEALLRRVLQGKGLYRVNTAVDAANLASLRHLLPVGLYDLDRVAGPVTFRLGRDGEEYPGIGKASIHVAGRPTLADAEGPFGNPSSDSFRTRVTLETRRLLFVVFAPAELPAARLDVARAESLEILQLHVGGSPDPPAAHRGQ